MRRVLLIFLSLVLALVGWSTVRAEDGFYVIPAMRGQYAPVPKTGQTVASAPGDDGALEKGVALPTPRFKINGNGTVTDKLTELVWMRDANAFGVRTWAQAISDANDLHSGSIPGLVDGSKVGDWRLPNVRELQSLIDYSQPAPPLPAGHPFTNVQSSNYWSSTTHAGFNAEYAWYVVFSDGIVTSCAKYCGLYVWCVRDPK
jgi:hypothetical protein